jgi:GT2 family glycosyltransferase
MALAAPFATTSKPTREQLTALAVIIPAHDEEELLGACLDSLEPAAWHAHESGVQQVYTLVVADACTDTTRATARVRGVGCLTVNGRNVGAARSAGATAALAELSRKGYDPAQTYLLHTDADTEVSADWLVRHIRAAAQHDAVLGPVEIRDWTPRGEHCIPLFEQACASEQNRHRVHGANLGVRAEAYLRAGGFPALPVAEDRALVEALRTAGASVVFRPDMAVFTSARISHRVRGGFSDFLSRLEDHAPVPVGTSRQTRARPAKTIMRRSSPL